jgi:Fur family ferric uptake transcriptional regulator
MTGSRRGAALESFVDYLRERGFSCTPQRRAVLEEILASPGHFDAEELAARMRRRNAAVSRATVYRTVGHLCKAGVVRKIDADQAHALYECTTGIGHHEHMICRRCGRIAEFQDPELEKRIDDIAERNGFHMTRHTVQLFGLCGRCHEQAHA